MTEVEQLKKRIENLEKLLDTSNKKVAILEETLSVVDKSKISKEIEDYIEHQRIQLRAADLFSNISNEVFDMSTQKENIKRLENKLKRIEAQIATEIKKTQSFETIDCEESLKYLKYEERNGEIIITGCNALSPINLVIPSMIEGKMVTGIAENAFNNNPTIKNIKLPSTLKYVGESAFAGCLNLEGVYGLNCDIGSFAFSFCLKLNTVDLGNEIQKIDDCCFKACESLENILLCNTKIKELSSDCLEGTGLKDITFPKTLHSIKGRALSARMLSKIIIPDFVQVVDNDFSFCSSNPPIKHIAFLGKDTEINEHIQYRDRLWNKINVIYCLEGSKVESYCQNHGIPYCPLSDFPFDERST